MFLFLFFFFLLGEHSSQNIYTKSQEITKCLKILLFMCCWKQSCDFFLYLSHSEGGKVAKDDTGNFSIKNNILSNPKGKLILL